MPETKKKRKPVPKGKKAHRRKKKKTSSWWAWPVSIIMIAILAVIGQAALEQKENYRIFQELRYTVDDDTFYPGVKIDGVDVAGRTLYEVLSSRRSYENSLKENLSVTLVYGDQQWRVVADDLDYQTDYEAVIRRAYQLGREGTMRERYDTIHQLANEGVDIPVSYSYDVSILRTITDEIAQSLSIPMVNANVKGFDIATFEFSFTDESAGQTVNADRLYEQALTALKSSNPGETVIVECTAVQPSVRKSDLVGKFGKVASYHTSCYGSNDNRIDNIRLALSELDGICVMPGETFSFNDTLGQRTAEKGYKKAGAFVDGLLAEELGGGICQVSTTLFNAVVRADMTITKRNAHSRPVGYVDKGADAAVSWPNQDFQFTNETDYPIFLHTYMYNRENDLAIEVYGKKLDNGMSIEIEAYVTETLQPGEDTYEYVYSLAPGEEDVVEKARKGYRTEAYKIYYDANDREIRRELLCKSLYKASGAVIEVGILR